GNQPENMFAEVLHIEPDETKAARVWKGIQQKLSAKNKQLIYYAFLSEQKGVEIKILRFVRRLFTDGKSIETDFGDSDVFDVIQNARKIKKEMQRILQCVRFQQT